ncbi:ABC transporter permease [Staphylococcus shinii]|uniref:ABC transporter permease n=1 Tax=Staphylococcus shinii TaxID=2912228 RepID=UPI003CEBF7AD
MINLVKRNLTYNVRDRVAFALSFLSVIILLVIYKAFLSDFQLDELKKASGSSIVSQSGIDMVNFWLVAGLIVVISITTTLSGFGVMVEDKETKKIEDFKLSGISSLKLMISYYITSFILGIIILILAILLGFSLFIGFDTLFDFSLNSWLKIIGLLLLSNLFGVTLGLFIANLLSTRSSFATMSTIIGTLVGFLAGVYISIGNLGETIGKFILILPMVHIGSLLKQVLMQDSINSYFNNIPQKYQDNYEKIYGIRLYWENSEITNSTSILVIFGWILAIFILNVVIISVKKRV